MHDSYTFCKLRLQIVVQSPLWPQKFIFWAKDSHSFLSCGTKIRIQPSKLLHDSYTFCELLPKIVLQSCLWPQKVVFWAKDSHSFVSCVARIWIHTEFWWSNRCVCLFFAVGFSFFLQIGAQRHGSKPYVTRAASFYAGIEQESHSTIEWCGQFRTCLCWYLLLRDSRRGHSRPNGQCLLRLGTIHRGFMPAYQERHAHGEFLWAIVYDRWFLRTLSGTHTSGVLAFPSWVPLRPFAEAA